MQGTHSETAEPDAGPPRPRFSFTLGVTGHRKSRIPAEWQAGVRARILHVVEAIRTQTLALAEEGRHWFDPEPPSLRVVSALADGADRWVAEAALAAGFALDAVLPFDLETYRADYPEGHERAAMEALHARAERRLVLPGTRSNAVEAYTMAGEALVAHATALVAVWDGEPGKGWGGTADVVETAVDSGVPVVQIPPDPSQPVRILWPSFEPFAAPTHYAVQAPSRPFAPGPLGDLLRELLLPPAEPAERGYLATFLKEPERRRRWRVEYPLLLHLAGVRPIRRDTLIAPPYRAATAQNWAEFRTEANGIAGSGTADIGAIEAAYSWADNLANHFAQVFRSGHVLNFTLAGLAAVTALVGLLLPGWKLWLVLLELAMIGGIIWNTRAGQAGHWQRRWLDYRALAERLQPIRSLKLLGVATPPRSPARKRRLGSRWTDWYANAHWRAFGVPDLVLNEARFAAVRQLIVRHQLAPEVAYHHVNAARMEKLEHRLHRFGQFLFASTVATCLAILVLYGLEKDWLTRNMGTFVFLTAGLPALGGATYALRVHGDYAGSAGRSEETAAEITRIREALEEPGISLLRSAALVEAAARIMLVDLDEWRLTYEQRGLAIPG
jgi:hypothetical protein